ncbi:PREDICTED: interleukin-12 receptor subunit beta-2-like isoform X2 [Elephantulus edwardii]|uniref:interleukin-12 receptor subunit beta-2-like isoform X2 n=1 Tax=Elephantulus edwardii TaxID=28737 RepID=UPI0003F0DB9C|nr:PREDICTED: interleukin-12 receptor subunit beta-2-like isoform X2 [Elephantulus edwardii]
MAYTMREYSLLFVFIIMWLLVKAEIDVCKNGDVTVKPSHVIALGSAVNISCSLNPREGRSRLSSSDKLFLYKFNEAIYFQNSSSLSFQVTGLPLGKTLFLCKLDCGRRNKDPICGVEIFVGVIPEQPQNVSCTQKGEHGTVTCTWDRGRDTHLYTVYTLQLQGPKNFTWQKQCNNHFCDPLDLGMGLNPESLESNYTVKVTAKNSLGSSSFSSTFTFLDIVRPLPPWDIGIKFLNTSERRCRLHWRDERLVLLNRLKYRSNKDRSWHMVNITHAKGRHDLLELKPYTEYEFQISSKIHLYKGSWSDWSKPLKTQTPEEKPIGILDVWYMKKHFDNNGQQISVFWKNLSLSEARGEILHYQVTWQEVASGKAMLQNITRLTSWTWNTSRTGSWTVTVAAANSKGSSLPTRINITDLCAAELLAPHSVSAHPASMDSMVVTWEPPKRASAIREYVVEWQELHPGDSSQPPLNWLRSPSHNLSALISVIPYTISENSHSINSLQPRVTYVLWMTALTAAGESPRGNEKEFCLQGKTNWNVFVAPSICIAVILVGMFSRHSFRQKLFLLLSALRPQWCSREIPDPANSTWAKKYLIVEDKMQLPWDKLLGAKHTPEEPETLVINEVIHQVTPDFKRPHCSNRTEEGQEIQSHHMSKEDATPLTVLTTETKHLGDLYKILLGKGPDSKPRNPASPLTVLSVDYLPTQEGYLPSNIDYLPSHETPVPEPLEEQEPQHITLSVFPSSSFHPLNFPCGEKLTLDQLKMGCGSVML